MRREKKKNNTNEEERTNFFSENFTPSTISSSYRENSRNKYSAKLKRGNSFQVRVYSLFNRLRLFTTGLFPKNCCRFNYISVLSIISSFGQKILFLYLFLYTYDIREKSSSKSTSNNRITWNSTRWTFSRRIESRTTNNISKIFYTCKNSISVQWVPFRVNTCPVPVQQRRLNRYTGATARRKDDRATARVSSPAEPSICSSRCTCTIIPEPRGQLPLTYNAARGWYALADEYSRPWFTGAN